MKTPVIRTKAQFEEWKDRADWSLIEDNDTLWGTPEGRNAPLLCNVNFVQDDEPETLFHLQGIDSFCLFTATQEEATLTYETLTSLLRRQHEKASVQ